jgi:hypothetical protein
METTIESSTAPSTEKANPDAAPVNPSPPSPEAAAQSREAAARRRTGKIAQLPRDLRDQVCVGLLNGEQYQDIIEKLGDHGKGVNKVNLHAWYTGGYQDWLKEQQLLEECRTRHELTLQFARENRGIEGIQAAHNVTVELLCRAVAEYGPEALKEAFQKNPLNVLRAFTALSRLSSGGLKFHKHQSEEERAARHAQNQTDGKKGISPEVLKQMIRELNLM